MRTMESQELYIMSSLQHQGNQDEVVCMTENKTRKQISFESNDELIKVIDEIMEERPELFKELAKR